MTRTLVLRVCKPDFTSRKGFKWPEEIGAVVEAPNWDATHETGYVGEGGVKPNVKPNVKYKLNSNNNFEEVTE